MKKKIVGFVKLQIPAGQAKPSPPVGPALGQRGLNIMEFCKAFNAATQNMEPGAPTPVVITAYADRSFTFITKTAPVSYFIKKAAKIDKGSNETGKKAAIGKISITQIREIAISKMSDMNANDEAAACRMVEGTAISMGIEIIKE